MEQRYIARLVLSQIEAVAAVFVGIQRDIGEHRGRCDGQVVGIGVSTFDHERLQIAEMDALPVLAWDEVEQGRVRLLCDQCCVLFKNVDCADELADHWRDRPAVA